MYRRAPSALSRPGSAWRASCRGVRPRARRAGGAIVLVVEILFTTLLVLAIVAVTWFSVYVVYRMYVDQS